MKKIFTILTLVAIFGLTTPVFAGPHGHGGHHGPSHRGGIKVHAGAHYRPHISHRHHGGIMISTGHYPRHSYRSYYRHGYWCDPCCNNRLGYVDPYFGYYPPMSGASFSISF